MSKDNVNSPSHYTQAGIECIDAITAAVSGKSGIEAVCVANVIKYLWRYEMKNGVEDIKKAQWYLNRLVSEMDNRAVELGAYTAADEPVIKYPFDGSNYCAHCGVQVK